jgi:hypothetical protein
VSGGSPLQQTQTDDLSRDVDPFDAMWETAEPEFEAPPPVEGESFLDTTWELAKYSYDQAKANLGTHLLAGNWENLTEEQRRGLSEVTAMASGYHEQPEQLQQFMEKIGTEAQDFGTALESGNYFDAGLEAIDFMGETLWEAITNPKGATWAATEQAANFAVSGIPGVIVGKAGALGGGAAGAAIAGPPGAAAGAKIFGVGGYITGASAGGFMIETGAQIREFITESGADPRDPAAVYQALQDPTIRQDWYTRAKDKGLSIAVADSIATVLGYKLLKGTKGPLSAGLRGAGAIGLETTGAAGGEIAGQRAATGEGETYAERVATGRVDWPEVGYEAALQIIGPGIMDPALAAYSARGYQAPAAEDDPIISPKVRTLDQNYDAITRELFKTAHADVAAAADQARQETAEQELAERQVNVAKLDLQEKSYPDPTRAETELFAFEVENGPSSMRVVQDPRDGEWKIRTMDDASLIEALAQTEVEESEVIVPGQPAPTTEGMEVTEEIDIGEPAPTTEGIEVEEVGEQIDMQRGPIYDKDREAKETPTEREWEGVSFEEAQAEAREKVYPNALRAKQSLARLKKQFPQTTLQEVKTDQGWELMPPSMVDAHRIQKESEARDVGLRPTEGEIDVTEGEVIDIGEPAPTTEGMEVEELPTTGVGEIPEGIEVEELTAEEIKLGRKIYTGKPRKPPPDDEGPPPGAPPPGGGVAPMGGAAAPLGAASETDLDDMSDAQIATRVEQIDARLEEFPRQIDSTDPNAVELMDEYHRLMTERRNMLDMTQLGWDMENVNRIRAETWEENHEFNAGGKKYDTILELEEKIEAAKGTQRVEREAAYQAQREAEEAETATSEATGQEIPISYLDEDEYRGFVDTAEARGDILIRGIGQVEVAGQQIVRMRREGDEEIEAKTAAAKPSMSKALAAAKEQAEADGREYVAAKDLPVTDVMQKAFEVVGKKKVLKAIDKEAPPGTWMGEPHSKARTADGIALNLLSKSDPKWPQPNKHGVYKNEDAEKVEFPARKTHQYSAELHLLEAYEGMWIEGSSITVGQGYSGGGISGPPIYDSRDEAANTVFRSWQKKAKDTEHRGHKAFKQWVDEKILETRPDRKPTQPPLTSETQAGPPAAWVGDGTNILEGPVQVRRSVLRFDDGGQTSKKRVLERLEEEYGLPPDLETNPSKISSYDLARAYNETAWAAQQGETVTETQEGPDRKPAHISQPDWDARNDPELREELKRISNAMGGWSMEQLSAHARRNNYGVPLNRPAIIEEAQRRFATEYKATGIHQEGPYDPDPDWPWAVLGHPTEDDKAGVLWAFGDTREEAENDFRENLTEKDEKVIDAAKDIVYVQIPPEIDYDYYDGNAREFYTDFYAGKLKEERAFGEPKGATFAGARPAATGEHPRVPGRMDTETLEDGTVYDLSKSAETQIATTVGTYDRVRDQYFPDVAAGDVLDYGAGKGLASQKHGFESLEPYPRGWSPDYQSTYDIRRQYDGVIMNNILNVLPKHTRRAVLWDAAEKTRPGGKIFVNVRSRGDVIKTKHQKVINKRNAEILTSRGTYQKGFTFGELVTFIGQELGPDYTVAKADPGSVAVIITKSKKLPPMWDGGGVREEGEQGYLPGMEPTQTEKTDYEAQHVADLFVERNPHFRGLRLSHKPGDERHGITQTHYYGEILNTEDADGMPADVILNVDHDPSVVSPIYIVNVVDPKTGEFEQHKTMAGFKDILDAEDGFIEQFNGDDRFGDVSLISPEMYREWLNNPEQLKKEFNPWTFRGEINKDKDLGKPVPGDNIMTAAFLAEKGDIVNFSPWLLADGSVVETGSDHVGYALERGISDDPTMDREVAVVSLFQQLGGAVRTAFFHDAIDGLNIAWLHMHTDQTLTPAQIGMLEEFFRESRKIKRKPAILIGTSGDGNNPQTVQVDSIAELKRMQAGVSEPKPAYGASDPNERLDRAGREDLSWTPAPEPPPMPAEVGPPPPIPPKGEPAEGTDWVPAPVPERPPEVDINGVLEASAATPSGSVGLSDVPISAQDGDRTIIHNAKWWKDAIDKRLTNLNKLRGCGR